MKLHIASAIITITDTPQNNFAAVSIACMVHLPVVPTECPLVLQRIGPKDSRTSFIRGIARAEAAFRPLDFISIQPSTNCNRDSRQIWADMAGYLTLVV